MALLQAETRIPTAFASAHIAAICANMAELEFRTETTSTGALVSPVVAEGFAELTAADGGLEVRASSPSEQGLSVLKFMMGLQLEKVAAAEKPEVIWSGHGCDLDELPGLREMRVKRIADITPHVRRITLAGENLGRFDCDSVHVRLLFPPAGLEKPEWPKPGKNGRPAWPPEDRRPVARLYTIRRVDAAAGEVDIDFVLHAAPGVASDWAKAAAPGALVGMLGPGGREVADAGWWLIGGDETAIPAIARILERLPAEAEWRVFLEVEDEAEIQQLRHPAGVAVTWLYRRGATPGQTRLLPDALRGVPLPERTDVFAWLGTEEAAAKEIRQYWRNELKLDRAQHLAVGYWQREKGQAA